MKKLIHEHNQASFLLSPNNLTEKQEKAFTNLKKLLKWTPKEKN